MFQPKITIITCTYNSAKTLRETLDSVKRQTFRNFEHLFIDGGSTDGTLAIIKEYYEQPALLVGKDKGLYDAFNKGLHNATGEIVGFLHSDDIFYDEQALERIAQAFKNETDYYCSKMIIFDEELRKSFAVLGAKPHRQTLRDQLYSSTYFAHPTYYCTKEIIKRIGDFDLSYKIAADIDWLYRLEKTTDNFYFDDQPLIKFRGDGGTSAGNYFRGLREEFAIRFKAEGLSMSLLTVYAYHYFRRLIRYCLEVFKLNSVIAICRKIILFGRRSK